MKPLHFAALLTCINGLQCVDINLCEDDGATCEVERRLDLSLDNQQFQFKGAK